MKRRMLLTLLIIALPLAAQEVKKEEKATQSVPPISPRSNVEITLYLLAGLAQASQPDALPKDLDGVVMQLRTLFTYQGFRVLDTILLRARETGTATVAGSMPTPGSSQEATYSIDTRRVYVTSDDRGRVVHLDSLNVVVMLLEKPENRMIGRFMTNIDVREGQKVVVGKANIDGSNNALILVVTAKVVD